jgi:hypothetical protein
MKHLFFILAIVSTLNSTAQNLNHKYYKHLVFRETPYSPTKGRQPITEVNAKTENHYQLTYDESNRLVLIKYGFGDKQISRTRAGILDGFRNVYSKTIITYKDNTETWTFYDAKGIQRNNMMNTYKEVYQLNAQGKRIGLKHYDKEGNLTNNNWNIAEYSWQHKNDYDVIEQRKNAVGDYVTMRPYYHFMTTLYKYSKDELLISMNHVDENNNSINDYNDKTGIAIDQATYDNDLNLIGFKFYNADNEATIGSFLESAGGKIEYDDNGNCIKYSTINLNDAAMLSRGKAYDIYTFDDYGNNIEVSYYGLNNELIEYRGYSKIKNIYDSEDPSKYVSTKRFRIKE